MSAVVACLPAVVDIVVVVVLLTVLPGIAMMTGTVLDTLSDTDTVVAGVGVRRVELCAGAATPN